MHMVMNPISLNIGRIVELQNEILRFVFRLWGTAEVKPNKIKQNTYTNDVLPGEAIAESTRSSLKTPARRPTNELAWYYGIFVPWP